MCKTPLHVAMDAQARCATSGVDTENAQTRLEVSDKERGVRFGGAGEVVSGDGGIVASFVC